MRLRTKVPMRPRFPAGSALAQHDFPGHGMKMEIADPQNASNHSAGALSLERERTRWKEKKKIKKRKRATPRQNARNDDDAGQMGPGSHPPVLRRVVAARVVLCAPSVEEDVPISRRSLVESRKCHGGEEGGKADAVLSRCIFLSLFFLLVPLLSTTSSSTTTT